MHSRRNALIAISGASLVGFTVASQRSDAQSLSEVRGAVVSNFQMGWAAAELALDWVIGTFRDSSIGNARKAAEDARSAFDAVLGNKVDLDLVRVEFLSLAQRMRLQDVSLKPTAHELPEFGSDVAAEEADESFDDVLWDVFRDALGFDKGFRKVFKELAKKLGLERPIAEIAKSAKNKNWFRCQRLLYQLFVRIFSAEALDLLEKQVGRKIMRRLLVRLAAYAVPAVGWAILATMIIAAFIKNHERILKAL